jgi:hypothetical protein
MMPPAQMFAPPPGLMPKTEEIAPPKKCLALNSSAAAKKSQLKRLRARP